MRKIAVNNLDSLFAAIAAEYKLYIPVDTAQRSGEKRQKKTDRYGDGTGGASIPMPDESHSVHTST